MTRTPMARLPYLIQTRFRVPKKVFGELKKTNIYGYFKEILLFNH